MIYVNGITIGTNIIYKGDMANEPGEGAVTKVNRKVSTGQVFEMNFSAGRLDPVDDSKTFDIALDDGRVFRGVYVSNIGGSYSDKTCRFMLGEGTSSVLQLAGLGAAAAIRVASLKAKGEAAAEAMRKAKAAALVAGKAIGLIPEDEFKAAKKRGSAAAYNLRIELKAAGFKARVVQDGYSALRVHLAAGSDKGKAEAIADKYEAGSFDGMTDCYNYDPGAWGLVFGDVRHVFCYLEPLQ